MLDYQSILVVMPQSRYPPSHRPFKKHHLSFQGASGAYHATNPTPRHTAEEFNHGICWNFEKKIYIRLSFQMALWQM